MYDLLLADGFNPEDKEFYDTIDQRLGLKPIASQGKKDVYSEVSPSGEALKKPKLAVQRQTVQGASRVKPSDKAQQYVPNQREKRMMNIMNVKEKDFVKEAQKLQKAKEQGKTMVTLFDEDQ